MKIYLISGEASGDLHGSNLMRALKAQNSSIHFRFWGGDLMQEVEDNLVTHYKNMAFMGFIEVIKHLPTILSFFKKAKKDILEFKPDRVILVDYPGFNLRMAKWLKKQNIPVTYYITPTVWAWHESRVKQIERYVDQPLCILPFEKAFFAKHGVHVDYVGHPLVDAIDQWEAEADFKTKHDIQKPVLALLPGSRRQEIEKLLPDMLEAAKAFQDQYQIVIAKSKSLPIELYHGVDASIKLIDNAAYDILNIADLAIVTSGTATLETALHKVPQVVCYRTSKLTYQIGKRLIDIKYISLVNLIMDDKVVIELIQDECTVDRIKEEVQVLTQGPQRERVLKQYDALEQILELGASKKAASLILSKHLT